MLLYQFLVPRLVELKQRPRVCKRGNKITSITTTSGVEFRDIVRLLAPSTSLRKFGQLFGLEQCKAHFPFAYLTSVARLQDESLPDDLELWKSDLTGPVATRADLETVRTEARQMWDQLGCQTVEDYLAGYLKLDVEILHEGSLRWIDRLEKLLDLNLVEAGKFTISSLSYAAGLKAAERRLTVGSFFPNNSQLYWVLRQGMRG